MLAVGSSSTSEFQLIYQTPPELIIALAIVAVVFAVVLVRRFSKT